MSHKNQAPDLSSSRGMKADAEIQRKSVGVDCSISRVTKACTTGTPGKSRSRYRKMNLSANSRHNTAIFSPSIKRATKRIRSSILDNSFQGILRPPQMPKSVTHVLGRSVTYVPGRTVSIDRFGVHGR